MSSNYLEQLAAEWYEYRGYFVRRHVMVGAKPGGGYEGELTILAVHLEQRDVVQVEPSMDAHSWEKREQRYESRFALGRHFIPQLVGDSADIGRLRQVALIGLGSSTNHPTLGGGEVLSLGEFLARIVAAFRGEENMTAQPVPQQYPILRTLQFIADNHRSVIPALLDEDPRQIRF
ncbi:MAG: hypothetical protein PVI25_01685 [Gammaproteobacteria bacterium]|nr:MAG: hypothetical protein AMJ59_26710 [Gammaproteobacteria bacterium SG8_31]